MSQRRSAEAKQQEKFRISGLMRAMQIPEDFVKGSILVSMQGQERLVIENFKGISSYTTEEIHLLTKKNSVCISGKCLLIETYTKDEIEISGRIERLEYR